MFTAAGRRVLGVMDLDPISEVRVVGAFGDADVTNVQWVNNERLIYSGHALDATIRAGDAGTFAVDHDGSNARTLIARRYAMNETESTIRSRTLPFGWFVHTTIDDGGDDVFVFRRANDATAT